MAYWKTLGDNWTLRDMDEDGRAGVFPAFPIEGPGLVADALKQRGLIASRPVGLDALKDQWIYAHGWLYETAFEWDGQDERCQLECALVLGLRQVAVNGQPFAAQGQALRLDITGAICEGENRLGIWVAPQGIGPLGIGAPVRLRAGNFMTVEEANFSVAQRGIEAQLTLNVHTGGKFQFKYGVLLGDDRVASLCLEEKLRPGLQALCHQVPVGEICPFDPEKPQDTCYALRLAVERQGIGCQLMVGDAAHITYAPQRVVALDPCLDEARALSQMALALALGADGVDFGGRAVNPIHGLIPAQSPPPAPCPAALAQWEDMQLIAADQPFWPPAEAGVWRLTGSALPDDKRLDQLFGANALGDAGRAARLTRFYQAEWVRRQALEARIGERPFAVGQLKESGPCLGSPALVEFSGAARPAYDALQEAWKPVALYPVLPKDWRITPGETAKIPLWLLSLGASREVARLQASCLTLEGKEVASVSLPAMLGQDGCVGELSLPVPPGDRAYVLRLEAVKGDTQAVARADYTLCACQGDAPLAPLMHLEGALLREKNGQLINEGNRAALGVCSAGYRALMPGENMPCADTYECLNGLV